MGIFDRLMGHASEVSPEKIAQQFTPILVEGEYLEKAFRLVRDLFVFTNKRLILVDKQGLSGSKVSYQSIPYHSITRFFKESTGLMDLDAELKIWIRGEAAPIQKEFRKNKHVNDVYLLLSKYTL
ncbi:PH domain-containing protein [Catalinimonas alkaloidigena]|uniref:PH domain-containing protein n=1 Tax=Catalinimonas alkaloidigena TaxID=1075417 RepID=A0A1G8YFJ7_9BACT|nr:PH domain-containing protein [Catalinimonas alkaloidigena]SDK00800.1 PH domain-containing protein [Catalinimonas alkaloidigena]